MALAITGTCGVCGAYTVITEETRMCGECVQMVKQEIGPATGATVDKTYVTEVVRIDGTPWYVRKSFDLMGDCVYEVALVLTIEESSVKVWWPVTSTYDHGLFWPDLIAKAQGDARSWLKPVGWKHIVSDVRSIYDPR